MGKNVVAVEAMAYNVNSYAYANQPASFQAEVIQDNQVLCATGDARHPFLAVELRYKRQRVERYSFQRGFVEAYQLSPDSYRWRDDPGFGGPFSRIEILATRPLLSRRVPFPSFDVVAAARVVVKGTVEIHKPVEKPWRNESVKPSSHYLGYAFEELDGSVIPFSPPDRPLSCVEITLSKGTFWRIFLFRKNLISYLKACFPCAIQLTITTGFSSPIGRCGLSFNWVNTRRGEATLS